MTDDPNRSPAMNWTLEDGRKIEMPNWTTLLITLPGDSRPSCRLDHFKGVEDTARHLTNWFGIQDAMQDIAADDRALNPADYY